MPNWPATLPDYVIESGYSETALAQKIESGMDTGPAKSRRRFTSRRRKFSVTIAMTPDQVADFEAFYDTDCQGGTEAFTWVHPRTRAAMDFKFRNPEPVFTARPGSGGEEIHVRITLEEA